MRYLEFPIRFMSPIEDTTNKIIQELISRIIHKRIKDSP